MGSSESGDITTCNLCVLINTQKGETCLRDSKHEHKLLTQDCEMRHE